MNIVVKHTWVDFSRNQQLLFSPIVAGVKSSDTSVFGNRGIYILGQCLLRLPFSSNKGFNMNNKSYTFILLIILLFALFASYAFLFHKPKTIQEIAFDKCHNRSKSTVYILEGGKYVPYLVLTKDYNGDVLLLRENTLNDPQRFNDYSSYYENSEIDRFLNESFFRKLSAIDEYIQVSNIAITKRQALGNAGCESSTISRKLFLLSATEIGFDEIIAGSTEGSPLLFFSDFNNRTAYDESNRSMTGWWLRTPNTYYDSCVYGIGSDGKLGEGNAYNYNGIRPAFCVSPTTPIYINSHIVQSKNLYCIKSQ